MIRCAISLGGNLGNVSATFDEACRRLAANTGIANFIVSPRYRTAPMGAAAGSEFLNAAAAFETKLNAEALLDVLQQVERDCGRVRTVHWGPRTLDLDLLLYGDHIIHSPRLCVPHPALWYRRFVLDPLCNVWPDAIHSSFEMTVVEVRTRLLPRPLPVCFQPYGGWTMPTRFGDQVQIVYRPGPADAAIVFASQDSAIPWLHLVRLPDDKTTAIQMMTDILTAALDEPTVMP